MSTTPFPSERLRDEHHSTMRGITPLIVLALVALGSGCNTELQSSWMTRGFTGPKFSSFVILGVSRETTLRRVAEDTFVDQLASRGIRSIPSYKFLPADPEPLPREQVEQAVKQQATQGAIVAWVARVDKQARGSGGSWGGSGYGGGFNSGTFGARYQDAWSRSYIGTGSSYEYNVVTVDVQLYDVKTGELVWSGETRTFDTSDMDSSTRYWAKEIIKELKKRGLI